MQRILGARTSSLDFYALVFLGRMVLPRHGMGMCFSFASTRYARGFAMMSYDTGGGFPVCGSLVIAVLAT